VQQEVMAMLPAAEAAAASPVVASLKQSLTLLDQLIAERNAIRNELTSLSQKVTTTTTLIISAAEY
jgi:response regulator of citrate/malate metabolism